MTGKLLIASPHLLTDGYFSKSVILITDDTETGTVGMILNRPLLYRLSEATSLKGDFQLFHGGPVEEDHLYFIHRLPDQIQNGVPVKDNIFFGGDFEQLKNGLNQNPGIFSDNNIKFFVGYSGWSPGQLQHEIGEKAWFVSDLVIDPFTINPRTVWGDLLPQVAPQYELWKNAPDNPELN